MQGNKISKVALGRSMKDLETLLRRCMMSRELDNLAGGSQNSLACPWRGLGLGFKGEDPGEQGTVFLTCSQLSLWFADDPD